MSNQNYTPQKRHEKKLLLSLIFHLFLQTIPIQSEGFLAGTFVKTFSGHAAIEQLNDDNYMNYTYETILTINDKTKIIMHHAIDPREFNCDYEDFIIFKNDEFDTIIAKGFIYHNLRQLACLLQKTLANQLILHESITTDLGYLFNEYSAIICGEKKQESTILRFIQKNNESYWAGIDYSLWAYEITTWIYNKPDGSIVFEITPFYPYMYCEPEEEPDYIPYEEWIKTYKPYFITTLSRETGLQLLEQAERIIKIIEDNQKRWDNHSKKDLKS